MRPFKSLLTAVIILQFCGSALAQNYKMRWLKPHAGDSLAFKSLEFNSNRDEYFPVMTGSGLLYFNSDRKNLQSGEQELACNENIWVTSVKNSKWLAPKRDYFFNSDNHGAIAGISADGSQVFLYKTYGNGDIYCSTNEGGKWESPKRLKYPINTDAHEQSVSIANRIMVISSERPGGKGKHDLYWSRQNSAGEFTDFAPILGLNTTSDEVDVSLSNDGKYLFYSSNCPGGKGGYDVFCSTLDSTGKWGSPVGFGEPLNTVYNDRGFAGMDTVFYVSSDRPGGKGGIDIYQGQIIPKMITSDTVTIYVDAIRYTNQKDTVLVIDIHGNQHNVVVVDTSVVTHPVDTVATDVNKGYYARVQVGAYFSMEVQEFKNAHPSMRSIPLFYETVQTANGMMRKFMVDEKYFILKDAVDMQSELIKKHKIKDAFIAIYNKANERVAIYNSTSKEFVMLTADKTPIDFK